MMRGDWALEQWSEAAKVRGRELDVGTHVPQRPLERTVEARQVVHTGSREQFGADREQRAVHAQIHPVLALAEGAHERRRLAGAERHPQPVGGVEPRGGLLGSQLLWHCAGSYIPLVLSRTLGEYPATC
jgi:hypothetical protein